MKPSRVNVKVKPRKGAGKASQVKAKLNSEPYVGSFYKIQSNMIDSLKAQNSSLKSQNDSLRRELDSIKVQLQIRMK